MGYIADRWGIRQAVVLTFAVIACGIFLLMGAKAISIACVFAVVYGFAIGAPLLVNPALTAECMGIKNFGPIFGILTLLNTFGVAIGAVLTGAIYDQWKSYMPAFWLFIVLIAIAGFSGTMARREEVEETR
jgi:MFS family permease